MCVVFDMCGRHGFLMFRYSTMARPHMRCMDHVIYIYIYICIYAKIISLVRRASISVLSVQVGAARVPYWVV